MSVHARRRALLRSDLAVRAADYCAEHGFDEVTTDQLAQGLAVSRATFFRYFASKDDAVVSAAVESKSSIATALDELTFKRADVWAALEDAAVEAASGSTMTARQLRNWRPMIAGSSALRGRLAFHRVEQRAELTRLLAERLDDEAAAVIYANAAFAALDTAWAWWGRDPRESIEVEIRHAFRSFARL